METINYKLDQFEGPLDLLLTLIAKHKIDINDIPIAMLCDQYMKYINAEENQNIEIASEFLVMASELMLIKSRMLLPKQEDDEDPRASLVEAMLEYQRAKAAAAKMNLLYSTYAMRMAKEQDEISVDKSYVAEHPAELLQRAFIKVMKETPVSDDKAKEKFEPLVSRPQISVMAVTSELITKLKLYGKIYLDEYFVSRSRSEIIAKFMAILELFRSGYVLVNLDGAENDEGVVNIVSHINVSLSADADTEKINELFSDESALKV